MATLFQKSLDDAIALMGMCEVEPRSALKQCASDNGVMYGDDMQQFVEWAEKRLYSD
jgi:hypothetical protein